MRSLAAVLVAAFLLIGVAIAPAAVNPASKAELSALKARVLKLEQRAPVPGPAGPRGERGSQGPVGPQGPPGPQGAPGQGASVEELAPVEEPRRSLDCFSDPSACGFPDADTSGSSGILTPSGSVTLSTAGQTFEGRNVTGSITVTAPNVTIRNDRVTPTESGSGSAAIHLESTGAKVIDTTVTGKGAGSQTVEAAVRGYDGMILEGDNFTLCNECVQGLDTTVRDTYVKVSSIYPGAHAEDIYTCSASIDVEHSTLLNEQGQTATVFADTICGGSNHYTVTNSLLAGGGYIFYPQANGSGAGGQTVVTDNRLARCISSEYESSDGHHLCRSGADTNGYFPNGGGYGVGAYFGGPLVWSANVWDDNGAAVPAP